MKRFNDKVYVINERMNVKLVLDDITIYVDDEVDEDIGYVRDENGIIPVMRSSPSANSIGKWLLRIDVWRERYQDRN